MSDSLGLTGGPRPSWVFGAPKTVLFLALLLLFGGWDLLASELLLYSPTVNLEGRTEVRQPEGKWALRIRSFSPVTQVELNGNPLPFRPSARVNLEIPYRLNPGENRFSLTVTTTEALETRSFVLYLPKPGEEALPQSPFRVYGSLGAAWDDNPERVNLGFSPKKPAAKLVLVLLPVYTEPQGADRELLYSAVLIRERYFSDQSIRPELFFNQLALDWQQRSPSWTWSLGAGANEIADQPTGVLELSEGNRHLESQQFLRAKAKGELTAKLSLWGQCELTRRNAALDLGPRYDYDGLMKGCNLGLGWDQSPILWKSELGSLQNDSLGDLQDYRETQAGLGGELPWEGSWTFKAALGSNRRAYQKHDPLKLAQESSQLLTLALGANYQPPGAEYLWAFEWKRLAQSSNVDFLRYQQNRLSGSLVFQF